MKYKSYLLALLVMFGQQCYCQTASDTSAIIKEFTEVMGFTVQPYLYYTTVTKMDAWPLLNDKDTISASGIFYKNKDNMYCNTTKDEMYIEDSLMVQINNDNKTIWVSKVDEYSRGKMNTLPVATAKMLEMIKKSYSVSKLKTADGFSRISIETRKAPGSNSPTNASVVLEYSEKTRLPRSISIEMSMKQPANDELVTAIKNEGIDEGKLLQNIGGIDYIVSRQRVNVVFTNIAGLKDKVNNIPSFKEKLAWDENTAQYQGKGIYQDYEITKTF